MTPDSPTGVRVDVRHSTHSGHCTDRPSRARVAESWRSFYGITSSTCREHLPAWQAMAGAWTASVRSGLTACARSVLCAASCGGSASVGERIAIVCWLTYLFSWAERVALWPVASCAGRLWAAAACTVYSSGGSRIA